MREQVEEIFMIIFMLLLWLLWLPCFLTGLLLGFCLVGLKDGINKVKDELGTV